MSRQKNLFSSPVVISSEGSEAGNSRSSSQGGRKTEKLSQVPAPARRSPPRVRKKAAPSAEESRSLIRARLESLLASPADTNGSPTGDISIRNFSASSVSVSLQQSLENRLRARMASSGSMELQLRWKNWDTPLRRRICALRASARKPGFLFALTESGNGLNSPSGHPTSGSVLVGLQHLPTPQSHDTREQGKGRPLTKTGRIQTHNGDSHSMNLPMVAHLFHLPTPRASDADKNARSPEGAMMESQRRNSNNDLGVTVQLFHYPTPCTGDVTGGKVPPCHADRETPSKLKQVVQLAVFPTPQTCEAPNMGTNRGDGKHRARTTPQSVVALVSWATTTSTDTNRGNLPPRETDTGVPLTQMVALISGPTAEPSHAPTKSRGVLDAAFSRWLMGFPEKWDEASPNWQNWYAVQDAIARGESKATGTP